MPLRTKVQGLTFDEIELGATASLTRTLTRTVIEVLALATGDASPFHIESDGKEIRQAANETQAVGAEVFHRVFSARNFRVPG